MWPVEFVVTGVPWSHQSHNRPALRRWRQQVRAAAGTVWTGPPHAGPSLRLAVRYYHEGPTARIDGDNLLKPIQDALNGLVYVDDHLVTHVEVVKADINGLFPVRGESLVLLRAFAQGDPFVYIRVELAPTPTVSP